MTVPGFLVARHRETGGDVDFCVAAISRENVGSIESIFVDEHHRNHGIGDALIRKALDWLDCMKVVSKVVYVATGNERVHAFYRRYGFYPRNVLMQQKEKK